MRPILASILVTFLVACGGGSGGDDQPSVQCSDGIDNDDDGAVDFPEDPGCTAEADETEDSLQSPQCNDGRDNDNDGLSDYPADPGCVAPQQDDEVDDCPTGPNCPECANDKDDDMNGSTDYPNDPGCTSASDYTEVINNPVACGAGLIIKQLPTTNTDEGKLDGSSKSMVPSPCGGGGGAPAVAYQLYLPRPKVVVVSTDDAVTTADTVIDIRKSECTPTTAEVACNDDAPGTTSGVSKLTASLAAGNYYIIVGARDSASGGDYSVTVKLFAGEGSTCATDPECGPGLVCRIPLGGAAKSCQQPMCKDGVDNDGDGKNDYPTDPGCTDPNDNSEVDMCPGVGAMCPECGDGADNDNDTKIDYPMDTTCLAAGDSSESCVTTDGVGLISGMLTPGTTVGANNDVRPSCASSSTHTAPDKTYRLDVPALSVMDINLINMVPSFWDSVTVLYNASCIGTPVKCSDATSMRLTNVAAGTYFFVVDGWSTSMGGYDISLTGKVQNNASCEGALFQSGALTCNAGYACAGPAGMRVCRGAACDDGMDNDGDGKTDYPADPGCMTPADNDEADPATAPVCADGMDNDADALVDWPSDYGCVAASGTSEAFCPTETNPTSLITGAVTTGTTAGQTSNFSTTTCISASGPDVTYALSLPVPVQTLVLDTNNAPFDTVVSVRDAQCTAEIACDDDGGDPGAQSKLTMTSVQPGNYAVVVDGYNGASGAFTLTVKGTVAAQTSCTSPLFQGGANAVLSCPTGTTCTGTPAKCQ
ncbi:MAG: hypothetical protein H0T46_10675 [Deltaproteobacteria bacterium]|nr:hypothetical protein [Deltaproteobacteria bacterium]